MSVENPNPQQHLPTTPVTSESSDQTSEDKLKAKRPRAHAALEAPQFRLSTLMILVTASCVVLAASLFLPPLLTFALILLVLAILAHVAGNFYGTKLRDGATEIIRSRGKGFRYADDPETKASLSEAATSRSNLTGKAPVGITLAVFIIGGAVAAIAAGCYWIGIAVKEPLALPDYVISSIAFGALGGMFGFMLGGFVCIGWRAMRQAVEESDK